MMVVMMMAVTNTKVVVWHPNAHISETEIVVVLNAQQYHKYRNDKW